MITNERMEKALKYLVDTDHEAAELKAEVERCEYRFKRSKAVAFRLAEGTVAERNAYAEVCEETEGAAEKYFSAIKDCETIRAKRQTEALVVDVWRSMNANRRTGNV